MHDKVVIITGASAGIGAELARLVGQRGGAPVLVARRREALEEVARLCGPRALVAAADVTRRAEVESAVQAALAQFGKIDVLVNNAGRGISRMVSELTDEDIDEMMLVNVKAMLYGAQAVLPHFRQRRQGHIINVSSMLGRVPIAPFRSAYSASKHAMNALTANLRMELRPLGIAVSTVHPGVVATEFGLNARHGGVDSRSLPGAQSVEEVAGVIAGVIESPRADVYTRPGAQKMVLDYLGAEDLGTAEQGPPFMPVRPPST
jgi:NADP-dependent 3-hydroxy acid dehydrogenase YdfG